MSTAMRSRRSRRGGWRAALTAIVVVLVGLALAVLVRITTDRPAEDTSSRSTTALATSTSAPQQTSASTQPTPTTSTTGTSGPPPTSSTTASTVGTTSTSIPPDITAPDPVTRLGAGPGGGSGEVSLRWGTVADAIGYRVLHASDPDGPFSVAADVNVRSGLTSAADGVTNVWSDRWTYHPPALASESFDGVPDEVHYVELLTEPGAVRYFQVIAYNEVRASTASRTICAAPSGGDPC